jgi:MFS family permease
MQAICRSFVMLCSVLLEECLNPTLSDSYHLMIGGFVLFEFCLFMISISKPEQYYQVIGLYHLHSGAVSLTNPKLFLTQGLGMGTAIGIMYIPALGIVSHYFQKRRALAIGLATSVGALPLSSSIYSSKDNQSRALHSEGRSTPSC